MKCPRCETELIEGSDKRPSFCHREAVGEQMVHLPDRCCDVLVGLLTKARRELEVDAIQILQLKILANPQQSGAAEERAAKAETEKAVAVKLANASLAAHVLTQGELEVATAKLADVARERDDVSMGLRTARAAIDNMMLQIAGIMPVDAKAHVAQLQAQLDEAKREIVAYEKRIPQLCSDYLAQVQAAERERDAALRWDDDDKDEWTADIEAAFPTRSGSHDSYAIALRMVGRRRSKGALVALVNWLLVERATWRARAEQLRAVLVDMGRDADHSVLGMKRQARDAVKADDAYAVRALTENPR